MFWKLCRKMLMQRCAEIDAQIHEKCTENLPKSMKNHSTSIKNGAKTYPKSIKMSLGAVSGRKSGPGPRHDAPGRWKDYTLGPFFRENYDFRRFWETLKIRGGGKNGPKNSIRRLFGAQKRPGGSQKSFLRGSEKLSKF